MELALPTTQRTEDGLRLERGADGRLVALQGGEPVVVRVCRCFPWSDPGKYLSLRDEKDNEIALVGDVGELPASSRRLLEDAVAEAGFVLEIEAVEEVEEEVEIRNWKVRTRHGPRRFQTRLDDWPRRTPCGGLLIRDVADDLLYVRDPETLDEKSQELLWAFLD